MTQFKLPDFTTPSAVCGPCLKAMRPERDAKGLPVWRCPKCHDEAPRKEENKKEDTL